MYPPRTDDYAAARKLLAILRGRYWHTTSVDGLRGILKDSKIRVNRGDLNNAYEQSKCSDCVLVEAVSVFDVVSHTDHDLIGDDLFLMYKWPCVMFRHRPETVFLGMAPEAVSEQMIYHPELKKINGLGGIIPRIESCHKGDIGIKNLEVFGLWHEDVPNVIEMFDSAQDLLQSKG